MKTFIIAILFLVGFAHNIKAKNTDTLVTRTEYFLLPGIYIDGELLPMVHIDDVYVLSKRKFKNRFEAARYERLVKNLKVVLPYARLAKKKYDEMASKYSAMEKNKDKRAYVNQIEKEIMDEFQPQLERLTVAQGKLLVKLLDREIGSTSYDILKEFKGAFTAALWQTLGRIFGYNLKTEYDPKGEDKIIEDLIYLIDIGAI